MNDHPTHFRAKISLPPRVPSITPQRFHKDEGKQQEMLKLIYIDYFIIIACQTTNKATQDQNTQTTSIILQQAAVDLSMKHQELYNMNINLYKIIWDQCSDAFQATLEGADEYQQYAPIICPIRLLNHYKYMSLKFENVTHHTTSAVDDAKVILYSFFRQIRTAFTSSIISSSRIYQMLWSTSKLRYWILHIHHQKCGFTAREH